MAQVDVKYPYCECTDAVKKHGLGMPGISVIVASCAVVLSSLTMLIAPVSPA